MAKVLTILILFVQFQADSKFRRLTELPYTFGEFRFA